MTIVNLTMPNSNSTPEEVNLPAGAIPISRSDLTPAELAELDAFQAKANDLPEGAVPIDPVAELSASELAELSVGNLFDPVTWADENQAKAFEPATLSKLAETKDILSSRGIGGFVFGDIGAVKSIKEGKPVEAVGKVVGPVAETFGNMARWFGRNIISSPANVTMAGFNELFRGDPGTTRELLNQAAKESAETVAATEAGLFGLADVVKKVASLTAGRGHQADRVDGVTSDDERRQTFLDDLGKYQQQKKIGSGQGEFATAQGVGAEDMAKLGITLDPQAISELASGDPFSFVAFGAGFKAISATGKVLATIPGVAGLSASAKALAAKGLTRSLEVGVDLTGKLISATGALASGASKIAPATGVVVGAVKGGPVGALAGLPAGELAARSLSATAKGLKTAGRSISEFGQKLAVEAGPVGSYTQLARDIIQSVPGVVGAVGKGVGIDLGFAAAVSETPQETEAMATFGTTFGALHGIAGAGRRIVQGQALGVRPWGTTEKTKPYGSFSELDAAHARSEQTRGPTEIQRADAIRRFAANLPGGAEVYLMPDKVAFENFLTSNYTRENGVAPTGRALANVKANAQTKGMFSAEMRDDAGQTRKVIILNEVDAAPHEAMHAIQDVIGDKANQVVDALVKTEYANQWESVGETSARRLAPGDARPWREIIRERSGWDADVYLARELAAENFDVAFKNKGGEFGRSDSLPERLARIAVRAAVFFGGDPYAGAETQGLRIQPKAGVIEAVKGQADLAKITPPVIPAAPVAPLVVPKGATPAPVKPTVTSSAVGVSPDAKAAQAWAAATNDPRLVNIVNNIVANQVKSGPGEAAPVRLKYLSVVGEEGSTRTPRRSEQEAAYLAEALGAMPAETRALVDKTHAHVRFDPVKKGAEMQSIGYSLEKLVENAQRTAKWMSENPEAAKLSPYSVEGTSFSAEGWKNLVADIQTYTENQQAGGTGAGKALVLPADAAKLGVSVPPIQAAKFSPLEQSKADFINTLMGFKLPETTRVSRAGGTPGNIVGQEISRANEQPFIQPRVSAPATERGGGKEFPGFPGKTIQEVNPLRRSLEAAGFLVDQLTEVVERVNLKHLESVTPAGEVKFRPGVTDTIRAGFLPPAAAEKPKWLVKGQKGGLKTQAEFEGADMGEARRKAEAQGYRVSAVERTNPVELQTQFLPPVEEAAQVEKLSQKGLQGWAAAQVGGFTATAHRAGQEATSQEFVNSLKIRAERFKDEAIVGMKNHDFNASMTSATKAQFFREAWEAATGTGSAGERLRAVDPSYKPPFPESPKTQFSPKDEIREIAAGYAKSAGIEYKPGKPATAVNEDLGKRLADFYDEAKSNPADPEVQKSYQALADETMAQYRAMADAGYSVEPFTGKGEPYKNSAEMVADVRDNKHLFFLRTEGNFSGGDNALLADSGVAINGQPLLVNDVFRAVHDFFGHAKEGLQFGPKGEFNAWRAHSEMFSSEAQGALAAETLAQNSFVNFGKHLRDAEGKIPAKGEPGYVPLAERKFAEQKNVVVPSDLIAEAKSQFSPKDPYAKYNKDYDAAVAKRKAGGRSSLTGWITPDNKLVPLSSNYHEQYLAENSASLNKKFGTKFSDVADVEERQQALDKGFVRMRMQGGTLHVEAGQTGWTKAARDKVFETVADNIDNIDQIQVSVLDKNGIVKRQGSERLMDYETDAEKLNNLPLISESRTQFSPAESENLPGMDVGREFNRAAINQMNRAELKAHFPEAIVPRSADEKINSNIVGSPLAKQEGGREAGVEAFANTLADFYRGIADQPEAKAGASWYSDFTPRLKKEFGKDAPVMAELLAATSPQTNPQVNFGYAFDALAGFKAGKYDKQIAKFNEGLERLADGSLAKIYDRDARAGKVNNPPENASDATHLAHWIEKHDIVPRGSSGKLFGTHSIRVLQVLARKWISMNAGPKTSNFVQNLLGTGSEATIDLWADRTMRRLGYSGYTDRWRILPENGTGVSEEDFAFSQAAFRAAANKLKIKPSALQGALWFGEKKYWSDKGWGRLDLGDYRDELKKVSLLRAGVRQREEAARLGRKAGSAEQEGLDLGLTIEPRQSKFKQ